MYPRRVIVCFFSLLAALTLTVNAQMGAKAQPSAATPTSASPAGVGTELSGVPMHGTGGDGSIQVSVLDDKMSHLDRSAVVKLYEERSKFATWQPTAKNASVTFDELGPGKYDFEVSAVGYLTGRKEIELTGSKPVKLEVNLHPDPDAIEFGAADESLSPKAAKESGKGMADLKAGNWKDAQKHLENALKEAPNSAHTNFLLGFVSFQQNSFDQAQTYLTKATTLDPKDIQALNLLGRLYLARKNYSAAKTTMEQAIATEPENATSHGLLADAYLNQTDYKNALAQADIALEKGKSHASNAQIVRGEALGDLGRDEEAVATLKTYLENAPDTAAGPQVKQWIEILEKRHANAAAAPPAKQ
jgi:Tfp pilus assembly protein PilF